MKNATKTERQKERKQKISLFYEECNKDRKTDRKKDRKTEKRQKDRKNEN
jgi:hypothetical protein